MVKGRDLFREHTPRWEEGGSFLLLNPRLPRTVLERLAAAEFPDLADHVWLGTSGTGGVLKLIALSRAALEASAHAVNAHLAAGADDTWLNPLPLFHAGGLGIVVRASISGAQVELLPDWDPSAFTRRADRIGAALSSLVPTQVHDLVQAGCRAPSSLRAVVVGGGFFDESLRAAAQQLGWPVLPSYGLTEAASQVATAYLGLSDAPWLPLLPHFEVRTNRQGLLELRGLSLLTGWLLFAADGPPRWEDPKIDGWFTTSDRAEVADGKITVLGRLDDLIKIRGELVDVGALERALQARVPSGHVRIDVESDPRNGARLAVIAAHAAACREAGDALDIFPAFARPHTCAVGPVPLTPLGKKVRPR
jgi:O-succinylbenzoic acid--CoA ligase